MVPGPKLLLMAYDQTLTMMDAFTRGMTVVIHIPVLSSVNLIVSPQYCVGWEHGPYYYYSKSVGSVRAHERLLSLC